VRRLVWDDEPVGTIPLPKAPLRMVMSFGSGLSRRRTDPPGVFWAVGDRGPNIKPKTLVEMYRFDTARTLEKHDGAKVMPCTDVGPAIAKLRVTGERIELVETLRITAPDGTPVSGLPNPSSAHAQCEPAFDLECRPLDPDPSGLDTEGIAALEGGGFWVGDEFGPSLVRLDARGRIQRRCLPEGIDTDGAGGAAEAVLPAIAAKRQLNRGFEAIALSPDERWLYLAFQSPLAHPDEHAHKNARHTRIWRLDAATLEVTGQYLYPFDDPASFVRDAAKEKIGWSDLKVSELLCVADDALLVLERCSQTTKFYRVQLSDDCALGAEHLTVAARPTAEQLSADGKVPELAKDLVFSTDDTPEVAADLEGMIVLSPTELLLVNDNDFGVEGAHTEFWLVEFTDPVLT
jgi:hypothetical protein